MIIARIENGKLVKDRETAAERKRMADNFAEIVSSRKAPGTLLTDQFLWSGRCNNHGIEGPDWLRKKTIDAAKKGGVSIAGKIYMPRLADKRGPADPNAWVGDNSELLAVCRRQNRDCELGHKAREVEPAADVPLAEDLVQETMQEYLQRDPGRATNLPELREEIIETHGAPANKKALSGKKRKRKV